jgi:hypothetical protein
MSNKAHPEVEGWEEETAGGFIKFEEPGYTFTGLITAYEKKNTAKGEANNYHVITKDGAQSFYAPKDLHDKLSGCIIKYGIKNFVVKVTFKQKIKTASGNDFKQFEVMHKRADEKTMAEFNINPDAEI